jgi:hypothetical protein
MDRHPKVILVHEPQPHWAPLLQWAFVESQEFEVRAVLHLVDFEEKLLQPDVIASLFVLGELRHPELIDFIVRYADRRAMFVLANELSPEVEWAFREAGAASVLESTIPVSRYVRILRKRLQ